MMYVIAWALAGFLIVVTVVVHYEVMLTVSDHVVPVVLRHSRGRMAIAVAVAALMVGHILEIWIFALTYIGVMQISAFGTIAGDFDGGFNSFLYFSAVNYTSLGDNGLHPEGAIRNIAAAETLAGLMMTAWSASFAYLKMEQIWQTHRQRRYTPGSAPRRRKDDKQRESV